MSAVTRFAVPVLLLAALAGSAAAETKYARVTIRNESDITILYEAKWDNKDVTKDLVLDPGKKYTMETAFPAGPTKPMLTIRYQKGKWQGRETLRLESGHVDPRTNNPGRVYDFQVKRTNEGVIVVVTPK